MIPLEIEFQTRKKKKNHHEIPMLYKTGFFFLLLPLLLRAVVKLLRILLFFYNADISDSIEIKSGEKEMFPLFRSLRTRTLNYN